MTRRLIESLRGVGAVHASGLLLRKTPYELSVWSDDQALGSGQNPGVVASIDGHIDITGIAEAVVLAGPDTLVLTIEDGRRMTFRLTSTGGGIVARGWLP